MYYFDIIKVSSEVFEVLLMGIPKVIGFDSTVAFHYSASIYFFQFHVYFLEVVFLG